MDSCGCIHGSIDFGGWGWLKGIVGDGICGGSGGRE